MKNSTFSFNCDFKTIEVEGKSVQTYSIGHGPKVILSFPAFPHSGLIYTLFMLHYDLSKVKLITFDLPGWIGSTEDFDKKGKFELEKVLSIVDRIIKEYKLDKFNVIGYSYGAFLAMNITSKYPDRVEKVALVSPIVKTSLAEKSTDAFKIRILKHTRLYFLMKMYIYIRFNKYRMALLEDGIPSHFLFSYQKIMKSVRSRYLFESLYHLFFTDSVELLKSIEDKKILIVNSKTETQYLRKQSGYIRQILDGEKSIYLRGDHQDFILHPDKDVIKKIVNFLIT